MGPLAGWNRDDFPGTRISAGAGGMVRNGEGTKTLEKHAFS